MTDTVADVARSPQSTPDEDARRGRILLALGAVASVVPFFWAAVRDGLNGFYPTLDVAATITRSRATFSPHPPLYGMWSSGSSWAGHEIHFPGAILLYLLAIPVEVLGNSWGTLLGMAVINSAFVLMTGWVVYRRLGVRVALLVFLLLNVFIWSIGSENLVDARPMEMVTLPFLCFLVLVWLVTSGEIDALPALAITANYLFLNHLVMALQIPVIGLCAAVGVVVWVRRVRNREDDAELDEPRSSRYRPLRRRLLQTGAITLGMWLPTLVQQFKNDPGNLTLLFQASGQHRDPVASYAVGYHAVIKLIMEPTFWFRGRFDESDFPRGIGRLGVWDVLAGVVLGGLVAGLAYAAWRRRDRLSLGALGVAVVAVVASIETVTQAPEGWGFPMPYLRSLWGLAAFVWFAVGFSAYRMLAARTRVRVAHLAGVGAIVFGVLGLSYANYGAATDMDQSGFARELVDEVVPQLTDRGKVMVTSGPGFESQRYFASLLLGLDTAGVHFCVSPSAAQQYGHQHDCGSEANIHVYVQAPEPAEHDRGRLIAKIRLLPDSEKAEFAHSRKVFKAWLADRDRIDMNPGIEQLLEQRDPHLFEEVEALLAPDDGDLTSLMGSQVFGRILAMDSAMRGGNDDGSGILAVQDAPLREMRRYFELYEGGRHGNIWVYERSAN